MTNLTKENFAEFINSNNLTVVKVSAEWCSPCKMMKPLISEVEKNENEVNFGEIDVDDNPDLAQELNIRGVPMIILYKKGVEITKRAGAMPKTDLEQMIEMGKRSKV